MSRSRRGRRGAAMTPARLAALVAALFVALAVPAAALVWLGFRQLDLESFRQQQIAAEAYVAGVDGRLAAALAREAARPAVEYSFALDADAAADGIVQRSPLASPTAASDIPGAIGYFQVDANGRLSTPLLPAERDFASFGLRDADDLAARLAVAATLEAILADNRLVDMPAATGGVNNDARRTDTATREADADDVASTGATRNEAAGDEAVAARSRPAAAVPAAPPAPEAADDNTAPVSDGADLRGQAAFDLLVSEPDTPAAAVAMRDTSRAAASVSPPAEARQRSAAGDASARLAAAAALEEAVIAGAGSDSAVNAAAGSAAAESPLPEPGSARVAAFDNALGPLVFSRLDTGHFVLFRDAWRGGRRDVQGILIDDDEFLGRALRDPFTAAGFAPGIRLHVDTDGRGAAAAGVDARTILRTRLAPPLAGIALAVTADSLPASPVRGVLVWSAIVLFAVLIGGTFVIYRFGVQQIALARQQRTFVSAVTHELRTPLTSIRMYGEMLRAGWASDAKKREYYEFIYAESERLSRLIDNVLTLAQIERGRDPVLETVTIGDALDTIAARVTAAVERSGFALTVVADTAVRGLPIRVDPDGLVQIFVNLIDNALKFAAAAERREIVLSAHASSDGRAVLRVRDFGPGLAGKDLKRLFELFYRPDSALTRSVAGTGIGLALVRQLAAGMDARVDAVNASPGAMFSLSLPVADP